jgi:valyl-tRNA synthetase
VARLDPLPEGVANTMVLTAPVGSIELDFSSGIDVAATRTRLAKELQAAEKELTQNQAKLANREFTDKAPEAVIAKVRARLVAAEGDIARIEAALEGLG